MDIPFYFLPYTKCGKNYCDWKNLDFEFSAKISFWGLLSKKINKFSKYLSTYLCVHVHVESLLYISRPLFYFHIVHYFYEDFPTTNLKSGMKLGLQKTI